MELYGKATWYCSESTSMLCRKKKQVRDVKIHRRVVVRRKIEDIKGAESWT